MRRISLSAVLVLLLCAILGTAPAEKADGSLTGWYENEWNYMSDAMDISQGIPGNATGVLGKIQRSGVLRVGVNPDCAPRVFPDPAQADGLGGADLTLARRIAERMGVQLKLVRLEETQILPALTENHCDLTISAVAFTPGRALAYTMSNGYDEPVTAPSIGILIREDSGISGLGDLTGKVLIAERNSVMEAYAAKHIPDYLEFRRASSVQTVYESVRQGKADAAIVSLTRAENYLKNNPGSGLQLAEGLTFTPDREYLGSRVAARKGETQLIAFVNGVIAETNRDGSYEAWLTEATARAGELGLMP